MEWFMSTNASNKHRQKKEFMIHMQDDTEEKPFTRLMYFCCALVSTCIGEITQD